MNKATVRVSLAMMAVASLWWMPTAIRSIEAFYPISGGIVARIAAIVAATVTLAVLVILVAGTWIAPSWLLVRSFYPADDIAVRALRAIVAALLIQPVVHGLIVAVGGRTLGPETYRAVWLGTQGALLVAAAFRWAPSRQHPSTTFSERTGMLGAFVVALALAWVARLAWADLNPDGTELLVLGRSLAAHVIARLPTGEIPGVNLGMVTVAYPIDWFLTAMGVTPAAARLPAVAYAAGIALGTVAIVEFRARRVLTGPEFATLLLGVGAVCLTIGFNASYDPYSTDLASPASIDLLSLVLLLALIRFLVAEERAWCLASAQLLSLTRPSAPLLCLLLVVAFIVVDRSWRTPRTRLALLAFATTVLVTAGYALAFERLIGDPVSEGGGNLLLRVRFLRFDELRRLVWLVVPSGIIPVLTVLQWRRFDAPGKAMMLVAAAYFAFFYCLAFVALHHFAPAMLLPLVAFWRAEIAASRASPLRIGALVIGAVVAIVAAFPGSLAVYRGAREVGQYLSYDVGDLRGGSDAARIALREGRVLDSLFSPYWAVPDATAERIGHPLTYIHYATLLGPRADSARYFVRDAALPAPAGTTRVTQLDGIALYVGDSTFWQQQRRSPPPLDPRSRWYNVERTTLFQHLGRPAHAYQVDVKAVAFRLLGRPAPVEP